METEVKITLEWLNNSWTDIQLTWTRWTDRFSYLSMFKLHLSDNFEHIQFQMHKYLGSPALGTSHIIIWRSSAESDRRHIFLDPPDLFSCNQPLEFRRIILQSPHVVVRGSKSDASCQTNSHWRRHLSGQLKINWFIFSDQSFFCLLLWLLLTSEVVYYILECCFYVYIHFHLFLSCKSTPLLLYACQLLRW